VRTGAGTNGPRLLLSLAWSTPKGDSRRVPQELTGILKFTVDCVRLARARRRVGAVHLEEFEFTMELIGLSYSAATGIRSAAEFSPSAVLLFPDTPAGAMLSARSLRRLAWISNSPRS